MRLPKLCAVKRTVVPRPVSLFPNLAGWLLTGLLALPMFAAPAPNKSLKLDGKGSYVSLPPGIFKDLTQATVEVWAKWSDFQAMSRIFEGGAGFQSVSLFNHGTNADLRFNIYPKYAKNDSRLMNIIHAKGVLRTNEWMHIAAVSGAGGMKLYLNGRLVGQHTNAESFAGIPVAQTNFLGRGLANNPADRDFRGELDEFRVWDHRRSLEQIRDFMFKRLSGREEGLVHLMNFEEGAPDDATGNGNHGRFHGKAKVIATDLDLALQPPPAPPAPVTPPTATPAAPEPPLAGPKPASNAAPVAAVVPSTPLSASPTSGFDPTWWIAGGLGAVVLLLAWLVLMVRRSALGGAKLLDSSTAKSLTAGAGSEALAHPEMKERALAELTNFAKESLVQGLYSQRAALLEAQKQAQQELAELETRLVALHLPERIQAYEKRIAELESQLESRSDELRELTHATLQLLRQKLEEEKQKEAKPGRFN